ncbi:MAG: hypothetical protein HZC36_09840 [Armatimonadetes bacterium]|nr:hypothetical protein [Armatimonadota bacterium]
MNQEEQFSQETGVNITDPETSLENWLKEPTKVPKEEERVAEDRYLGERSQLIARESQLADLFDKSLITITSAALGTSLAFLEKVADKADSGARLLFQSAWLVLSCTLLCSLLSMFFAQRSHHRFVDNLDDERREELGMPQEHPERKNASRWRKNPWCVLADCFNVLSATAVVVGIVLLFVSLAEIPWKQDLKVSTPDKIESATGVEMKKTGAGGGGMRRTESSGGHGRAVNGSQKKATGNGKAKKPSDAEKKEKTDGN